MNFVDFLKDKAFSVLFVVLSSLFAVVLMNMLGVGAYAAGFITGLFLLGQAAALGMEYFQKKTFYNELFQHLEKLDKKYLLSELLDEPSFLEGKLLYEVEKTTNKAMNDEIARYRLASREYREYIETWVHEVKTPISSSKLIIENNRNKITLNLNEELSKIENYVEQALFYSRSNSVEKDYVIKQTTLKELVNSSLKKYSALLIESKVHVETSALDKTVFTDVKWTDFMIGQILMNSIKYRKGNPFLKICGLQNENSVTLIIEDNGIGIPKKDLGRVFEKGFTGENGRKIAKSTGIGLYLCKKLCDKLNLGISIASNEGAGTMVSLVFPKSNMYL
ncbi:HAMP domain-containing histidine kinase [Caproiciproducens galactitolivorans]|uniref:histidine kinase n=1 Tax=Caproiciproducens galactitolivorans TaxID=642589 RepID=A0A4Z0YCI4_9FIRM|nr:sensor histidine kinase [Caproiciproducens galactitolivorans]QEY34554.1 HAMP domain-containing histidine kinase [Caproiciproducens galactitolivorans]TGJ77658.1 sensor histidine kinase GraS [Caproiciproducens galactitolivorans]